MRLTLRAMIAYLDESLEPADAKDIGEQIAASEQATNLLHRIRDVTRRLRLSAPRLYGKGMGLDPNTVAEYLDYTMPGARVADFEKICLESDMQLAEVAASHQILALVLGEPAEIEIKSRERMYRLLAQADILAAALSDSAHRTPPTSTSATPQPPAVSHPPAVPAPEVRPTATSAAATAVEKTAATASSPEADDRKKPEIPDYLREGPTSRPRKSRAMALAAAVLLVALIGAAVVFQDKLAEWLKGQSVTQQPTSTEEPLLPSTTAVVDSTKQGGTTATAPGDATVLGNANTPVGSAPSSNAQPTPAATPAGKAAAPQLSQPGDSKTTTPTPPATAKNAPEPAPLPADAKTTPTAPTPVAPTPIVPIPKTTTVPITPVLPATPASIPSPVAPAAVAMGTVATDGNVLVRVSEASAGVWQRLPIQTKVAANDRLLSFPTFRSTVNLENKLGVQLVGGSLAQLVTPDARQVPGLIFHYGRIIISANGAAGSELRFGAGTRQGVFTFNQGDSLLAIDMKPLKVDGADPQAAPAPRIIELYVAQGEVTWRDAANPQPVTAAAPAKFPLGVAPQPDVVDRSIPDWVRADDSSETEKLAMPVVERGTRERPLTVVLKELADDRRVEVRLLAVQCLSQIGEFEALVAALREEAQAKNWDAQIDALREAIWMDPATATRVRQVMEAHKGPAKGGDLFRLLWGFSPQQLREGDSTKLVKLLDFDDLDFRVLAFWNLRRIAGGNTLAYRPEYSQAKRKPMIAKWDQLNTTGQLIPKP